MDLQQMIEARSKLGAEIRAMAEAFNAKRAKGENWTAEEEASWTKLNKDFDDLSTQIADRQRADAVTARALEIQNINEQAQRQNFRPNNDTQVAGLNGQTYGDLFQGNRDASSQFATRERQRQLAFRAVLASSISADGQVPSFDEETRNALTALGAQVRSNQIVFDTVDSTTHRQMQAAFSNLTQQQRQAGGIEQRWLSSYTPAAGANLIPITFLSAYEMAVLTYGDMLSVVGTILSDTAEDMSEPTVDDTANSSQWGPAVESSDVGTAGPDPDFGKNVLGAHEVHSNWVLIPWRLGYGAAGNGIDVENVVANLLGERMGRGYNYGVTNGTGAAAKQPKGFMDPTVGAPVGVVAGSATVLSFDDIISLEHSVDAAHRGQAVYALNDQVVATLRKVKDTNGRYLWQDSVALGQQSTLNGKRAVINNDMPATVASKANVIAFGNFQSYRFRRLRQQRVVFARELFSSKFSTGVIIYSLADGLTRNFTNKDRCAIKLLQMA